MDEVFSTRRHSSRSSKGSGARSPKKRKRTFSFSMSVMASSRYFLRRPMMAETSSMGRFQFSVEKAYTVR